jgi:KUP system potassium uptake protein
MHHIAGLRPRVRRVPGTAVFLTADQDVVPPALLANVEHNHVIHQHVIAMTIQTERRPHVPPAERLVANHTGVAHHRATQLIARFGYQDHPNVPAALRLASAQGLLGPMGGTDISYFLSTVQIETTDAPTMSRWRKLLYVTMAHNKADEALHFRLPAGMVVTMGQEVEI